jgi:hypothetical protein
MFKVRWQVWGFVLVWASPLVARAEGAAVPPAYTAPAPVKRAFATGKVTVVVTDARPTAARKTELLPPELSFALKERLAKSVGHGADELVFRVKLLVARETSESSSTVRAVVDVSTEYEGRVLATTRGDSTLVGQLGGMTPQTEERVRAAVIDAFERSVLRDAFIEATNGGLTETSEPIQIDERVSKWTIDYHEETGAAHVVSGVLDAGKSYALGARYLHDHFHVGNGLMWGGYGLEGRLISADLARLDAAAALAILRAGMAVEMPLSLELGLGVGGWDELGLAAVVGGFISFYYVDLGVTIQFVEDVELRGPNLGLRINIPFDVHGKKLDCRSPTPCRSELPPG